MDFEQHAAQGERSDILNGILEMVAKRKSVGKGNVLTAATWNVRSLVEDSEDVRTCRGRT